MKISTVLDKIDKHQLFVPAFQREGAADVALSPVPLARAHLPSNPAASGSIRLSSIANVVGVNQLAPLQQLAFEPAGLTIIYGDNGAGKSG
jgi:hypothetical protein